MRVHAVPVWQGATWDGAATRLTTGCRVLAALAGEVLGRPVEYVPCDAADSPPVRGVAHRAALVDNRRPQLTALENPEGRVLTVGASCAADLVPAGVARFRYGADLGMVWFDTHPDCDTAETSPSGAFNGMVLRCLLGEGDPDFAASPALAPGRAVLAGASVFDHDERAVVERGLVRHVPAPVRPAELVATLREAGVRSVYVHFDLDVLDRSEFSATVGQARAGLTVAEVVAALDALAEFDVIGAAVTECTAAGRDEVAPLVPVLEALGRRLS